MKNLLFIVLVLIPALCLAQGEESDLSTIVDTLYREDQLYVGLTFNLLSNGPRNFSQNGLSAGLQVGFIRDFPLNKKRDRALGIGLGVSVDTYNHNLLIGDLNQDQVSVFTILDDSVNEDQNRFTYYTAEIPIEYRWRTSSPKKYAFWRIHAGMRLGYIFSFRTSFVDGETNLSRCDLSEVNTFQYGPSLSFGYGTFNFQAYYGISTLFNESASIEGENINLQVIRLGLIFYFL